MQLIDTSAWIEFFRKKGDPAVKQYVANLIAANEAAYACPVRFELFFGARDNELAPLAKGLSFATRLEMVASDWDRAAQRGRILTKKGITVPRDDLLIATIALNRGVRLICRDPHFSLIQSEVYPSLVIQNL